jgi:hypothetical protein
MWDSELARFVGVGAGTAGIPTQAPAWQLSLAVPSSPSSQAVPLALPGYRHRPVGGSHDPGFWQGLPLPHTTRLLPRHVPVEHVSVRVHMLPSLQVVPSALFGFEHAPVEVLQVPTEWHWSNAVQTTGLVPLQVPLWQESVVVQALPSLQATPFAFTGLEQVPFEVLHTPTSWHWSEAVQTTGFPPVHVPAWQVSARVHALPSLQVVPSALFGFEQTPLDVSQVPTAWH